MKKGSRVSIADWTAVIDGKRRCPNCGKSPNAKPIVVCPFEHWAHYQRERDKTNAWRNDNREHYNHLKQKRDSFHLYGLTPEQLEQMLKTQNGKCAICGRNIDDYILVKTKHPKMTGGVQMRRKYFVDHDHRTNVNRGLLCNKCNFMIGYADENPDILRNAIAYLEKWNKRDYIPKEAISQ